VGRGKPQRIFSGDRIRIGEYEISVEVVGEDDTDQQLVDGRHVDPVSRAQRVPPPDPTRADLIPAHEISAVGIEMLISEEAELESLQRAAKASAASLRLEDDPPPAPHDRLAESARVATRAEPPPVSAAARIAPSAAPKPVVAPTIPPPASATKTPTRPTPPATATTALAAFFRGAGLPAQKLDERQAEQTLHRLGQLMRELVLGINDNLHLRAEQKTLLRVPTTTIQAQNNNPLKFSASVEEALTNLLFRQSAEYLTAVDAIRETFTDIKKHQQQLLNALGRAIPDYVGRLDPDELESKFTSGKRGALINAANKLKYWDLYKDLYQVVTQHQPGQLPQQFLEELAHAYELEESRAGTASAARHPRAKLG
jgi:type VI secretion system FHA domain protein